MHNLKALYFKSSVSLGLQIELSAPFKSVRSPWWFSCLFPRHQLAMAYKNNNHERLVSKKAFFWLFLKSQYIMYVFERSEAMWDYTGRHARHSTIVITILHHYRKVLCCFTPLLCSGPSVYHLVGWSRIPCSFRLVNHWLGLLCQQSSAVRMKLLIRQIQH